MARRVVKSNNTEPHLKLRRRTVYSTVSFAPLYQHAWRCIFYTSQNHQLRRVGVNLLRSPLYELGDFTLDACGVAPATRRGTLTITRAEGTLTFPARFAVVARYEPWPCSVRRACGCDCRCDDVKTALDADRSAVRRERALARRRGRSSTPIWKRTLAATLLPTGGRTALGRRLDRSRLFGTSTAIRVGISPTRFSQADGVVGR